MTKQCKHKRRVKGLAAMLATGGLCNDICLDCDTGFLNNNPFYDLKTIKADGLEVSCSSVPLELSKKSKKMKGFYISTGDAI